MGSDQSGSDSAIASFRIRSSPRAVSPIDLNIASRGEQAG
jgi:hypothetical protein